MKWPTIKVNLLSLWKLWKLFKKYVLRRQVNNRNYGLIRDKWDERDHYYKVSKPGLAPPSTNRRNINQFPWRYDQGSLGSCCGFGAIEAFRRTLQVNHMPDLNPSALFAYYTLRTNKNSDSGGQIRDAFKAMNQYGVCSERTWPYIKEKVSTVPPPIAFEEALNHQTIRYERIYPVTKEAIMDAVSQGFAVVYGKDLFSSFESTQVARTGIVEMPKKCEASIGGHCMVIMDYDEKGTIELNSWGSDWGQGGVCHFPWEYVLNWTWCNDFWVIYLTE
jgi:C1A family cysteine protease